MSQLWLFFHGLPDSWHLCIEAKHCASVTRLSLCLTEQSHLQKWVSFSFLARQHVSNSFPRSKFVPETNFILQKNNRNLINNIDIHFTHNHCHIYKVCQCDLWNRHSKFLWSQEFLAITGQCLCASVSFLFVKILPNFKMLATSIGNFTSPDLPICLYWLFGIPALCLYSPR